MHGAGGVGGDRNGTSNCPSRIEDIPHAETTKKTKEQRARQLIKGAGRQKSMLFLCQSVESSLLKEKLKLPYKFEETRSL